MSCSKPLPPFVCDLLYYLNRDQLERFSIICRPLKNFIERYLHSKPYRVFEGLGIHGGSYALTHKGIAWHPNRDDYSVQQFLASQEYSGDHLNFRTTYYSFDEMRPYLGPTVRIKLLNLLVAGDSTYNPEHITEMESIAYLWHDGNIRIPPARKVGGIVAGWAGRIVAKDFQLILNSPTILQCQELLVQNVHFSFKDYKVLYAVKIIRIVHCLDKKIDLWCQYWQEFFEQPGVKPVVLFHRIKWEYIDNLLDRLSKAFSSAVSPYTFKIIFPSWKERFEFKKTNKISGEILELKKGRPTEIKYKDYSTLERYSI